MYRFVVQISVWLVLVTAATAVQAEQQAGDVSSVKSVRVVNPTREIIEFNKSGLSKNYPRGSIIIVNSERRLYYALGNGKAVRYSVAVGTPKNQWTGKSFVQHKAKNPSWTPPWDTSRRVPGGPDNPLGIRAIYLGWSLYRIHGTNNPGSIGEAASRGCIRMLNQDVVDLYKRVHIGAPVHVVR